MSSSASSGTSCTTTFSGAAASASRRVRAAISGWVIASRSLRARASAKTIAPKAPRSREPSGVITTSPKRWRIAARPSESTATTSRASWSASMTTAPSSRNRCATVDLPEPIPPVSPTRSMRPTLARSRLDSWSPPLKPERTKAPVVTGAFVMMPVTRSDLVPGELLTQSGERLIRSQRALRGRRVGRGRGRTVRLRGRCTVRGVAGRLLRVGCSLGVSLDGLLDLNLVRLPASVSLGELLLPLLALLLVTADPFVGLGVEALGVLVVAGLVVLGSHAVHRRVELGDRAAGVVGLLERKRDTATLQVDVDDLDEDVVADVDNLLRQLHVALGQLGDVDQALDAVVHADERTERDQLGDLARNDLADRVGAREVLPRVFLRCLQGQRDTLTVHVDVEHLDGDLLADLDDLGRVVDVLPGQLGDVDQTVDATKVHEGAEVDDAADDPRADLTLLELLEERGANLGLGLLEPGAAGQDHVVAVLVQLNDLGFDLLADVRLEVADAAHLDQGGRQDPAKADIEDESTLDDLDDGTRDDAVLFFDLLDRAPGALGLCAHLGQDQPALLVLLLEDKGFDCITHGNDVSRVDIVLDGKFARGDDTLGLVADVEQNLVTVNLDDDSFDDIAVAEMLDRRVDRGEKLLLRSDVVDRDLGAGLHGRAGSHVVGTPIVDRLTKGSRHNMSGARVDGAGGNWCLCDALADALMRATDAGHLRAFVADLQTLPMRPHSGQRRGLGQDSQRERPEPGH